MSELKILNDDQYFDLISDMYKGKVKRFGWFQYREYRFFVERIK